MKTPCDWTKEEMAGGFLFQKLHLFTLSLYVFCYFSWLTWCHFSSRKVKRREAEFTLTTLSSPLCFAASQMLPVMGKWQNRDQVVTMQTFICDV